MLMMSTGISVARCMEPAPGAHDPEEQCRADDAQRVRPTEERDGDPVEAEVDEVLGRVVLRVAEDLDAAAHAGEAAGDAHGEDDDERRPDAGVACGAGIRAHGSDLEAQRRLEQHEPDGERGEQRQR